MKNYINYKYNWLLLSLFTFMSIAPALAQDDKKDKAKEIENMVESGAFVFHARTASPMRGRTVQLTSAYDVMITKDSLRTYLPYYGRAYMAQPYRGDGGIKISTTDFKYEITNKKRNRWHITIEPEDKTEVQQFLLSVSKSGSATLQVVSTYRDAISFYGYISKKE